MSEESSVRRVLIVGASGSGKTTLARRLARQADAPLHHLDEIARVGGGIGPERSYAERAAAVAQVLAQEEWIAEGIHLGWTEPLFVHADLIVWLDHVSWSKASGRVVRRFVTQAIAEARAQKGLRKIIRFRDYGRQLRALAGSVREARTYQRAARSEHDRNEVSRAATEEQLARYASKVVRCTAPADVEAVIARLTAKSG